MKRIILFVLLLTVGFTAQAQRKKPITHRHEVSVGMGIFPIISSHVNQVYLGGPDLPGEIENYKEIHLPAFNALYGYRFSKLFTLQGALSFAGSLKPFYDIYTDKKIITEKISQLTILPIARFNWNREGSLVTVYSSVGFGMSMSWQKNRNAREEDNNFMLAPAFHFNPIGISIGRKLYGFAELQASSIGVIHMGVGYRFNYKK